MCAALQVCKSIGKRTPRTSVNSLLANTNSSLFHVYDNRSRNYFLVDTGCVLSIVPPNKSDQKRTSSQQLIAANGKPIKTFGTRLMVLFLGLQKLKWRFIVVDVTKPIIGGDFLNSYSLLVDLANERLIGTDNLKTIRGARYQHESFHISQKTNFQNYSTSGLS